MEVPQTIRNATYAMIQEFHFQVLALRKWKQLRILSQQLLVALGGSTGIRAEMSGLQNRRRAWGGGGEAQSAGVRATLLCSHALCALGTCWPQIRASATGASLPKMSARPVFLLPFDVCSWFRHCLVCPPVPLGSSAWQLQKTAHPIRWFTCPRAFVSRIIV